MDKNAGLISYLKDKIARKALDASREPALKWIKSREGRDFTKKVVKSGIRSLISEYKYPLMAAAIAGTGVGTGTILSVARSEKNRKDIEDLKKKLKIAAGRDVGVRDIASTMARLAVGGPVAEGVGSTILSVANPERARSWVSSKS